MSITIYEQMVLNMIKMPIDMKKISGSLLFDRNYYSSMIFGDPLLDRKLSPSFIWG